MSSSNFNSDDDSLNCRRSQVAEPEPREVKFASKGLSQERLQALKDFLKQASSDEIAAVRKLYGDNREVLQAIGLEISDSRFQ